jgi:hypothetical protein
VVPDECRHRFDGGPRATALLKGQADATEHARARPLLGAVELAAALGGDGVRLHGAAAPDGPDELLRALPRHHISSVWEQLVYRS